jgi:hypothetical protein
MTDRTAMTWSQDTVGQPEHDRNRGDSQPEQDRTARKGQPEEDNQNRKGLSLPLSLVMFLIIHLTTVYCKRQVKKIVLFIMYVSFQNTVFA